jgi:4-amino-4-deoxy-L-arabinose transferase-like glycosyltransferase
MAADTTTTDTSDSAEAASDPADVTDTARVTAAAPGEDATGAGTAAGDHDGGERRRLLWLRWPRPADVRSRLPEIAVVAVALALNLWNLSTNGYGNTYYAAAVRSMSHSWHDFFYASVDPGGWITVDKPPLALWVQALSVRLFGYSSWSMLVPGALAGAAAVALVVAMVRRSWGRAPGLIAGITLATTPVAVAVARSNNPDGMLALLVTAAAFALLRAVEAGRLRWLLGAAALVAAAFLTKLLAALIVLPALWLAYLLFARRPWRVRVAHLVAATGLLTVLCAGWVLAVDHTPLSSRPWIGGSTDGSAADLVLGYNGIGRITGAEQGPGGGGFPGGGFPGGGFPGGGIDQFGGQPGIGRLFNAGMGDQIMWLAPVAVAAVIGGLWVTRRRQDGDHSRAALVVLLGTWAVTTFAVFSYAQGIFHNYYVSLLAPALAGLVGVGAAVVHRTGSWGRLAAAAVVATTAAVQLVLLRRIDAYNWLRPTVTIVLLAIAAGLASAASRRTRSRLVVAAVGVMLVAPAVWSFAGGRTAQNPTFPDSRPATAAALAGPFGAGGPGGSGGPGGPGGFGGGLDEDVLTWLRDQSDGERWLVAVGGVQQATAAIIDGDSVMPMGGFSGGDPAMAPAQLAQLVRDGQLRFVLTSGLGGFGGPGGLGAGADISSIVSTACTAVPSVADGLYDCAGKDDAIAEAAEAAASDTAPATRAGPLDADVDDLRECLATEGITVPDDGALPDLDDPDLLEALTTCAIPARD